MPGSRSRAVDCLSRGKDEGVWSGEVCIGEWGECVWQMLFVSGDRQVGSRYSLRVCNSPFCWVEDVVVHGDRCRLSIERAAGRGLGVVIRVVPCVGAERST